MNNIYIKKNKEYLGKNFKFYKDKKQAMRFSDRTEAERVLNSNISATQRNQCTIVTESQNNKKKNTSKTKFVVVKDINTKNIAADILSAIEKRDALRGAMDELEFLLNSGKSKLEQRHEYVSSRLSALDKEITDIVHYIEFNELNEEAGFAAYKMLHERTNERRNIKNEKYDIEFVLDVMNGRKTLSVCKAHFENKAAPTYIPRALPELFGKAV